MNKKEFLDQLNRHLRPLSLEDRKEIIEDYSMLIDEKINETSSEEDVIASLDPPRSIATQYINELLGDTPILGEKPKSSNLALFIGMQFFNFLIGIWLIFSAFTTAASLSFSGIMTIITSFSVIFIPTQYGIISNFFALLIVTSVGLLLFNAGLILGMLCVIGTKKYYAWNLSLLR